MHSFLWALIILHQPQQPYSRPQGLSAAGSDLSDWIRSFETDVKTKKAPRGQYKRDTVNIEDGSTSTLGNAFVSRLPQASTLYFCLIFLAEILPDFLSSIFIMTTMPKASVNAQPSNLNSMDLYKGYHTIPNDEKYAHRHPHHEEYLQSEYSNECESSHKGCHGSRLRRIVLPALIISLILSALLAITCMDTGDLFGLGMDGLARRAAGDTTEDGAFVDNKRRSPHSQVSENAVLNSPSVSHRHLRWSSGGSDSCDNA